MRILLAEDEMDIVDFLQKELEHEGYAVSVAHTGREALSRAEGQDLILLDILLPELSGLEVLRRLRRESAVPIILLTARDSVMDKVTGLDMGADDYITKPFDIEELLARIRVARRNASRGERSAPLHITVGNLRLDKAAHRIYQDERELDLTRREFELLAYFMANPNVALAREIILRDVWGYDHLTDGNIIEVYVRYIRNKLQKRPGCTYIQTIRGVGYALKAQIPGWR